MPKGIKKEELLHVAEIARLELTEEEIKLFSKQVSDVIEWFKELGKINTKDVAPSFHPLETVNVTREDVVKECFSKEETFANTNNKEKGFFKGPRIV